MPADTGQEPQGAQVAAEGTGESGQGPILRGPKGRFKGFELPPEGSGEMVKGFKGEYFCVS